MIEAIFQYSIKLFFWLVGIIGQLTILPLEILLYNLFPDISEFLNIVLTWVQTYIFPAISFCKEAFLDITKCPRSLFYMFISTVILRWAISPAVRSIKLLVNVWKLAHGETTKE